MEFTRPSWDEMFMLQAILGAVRSSCLVRRCGANIVKDKRIIASGYNGAPPEVETCLSTGVCFYQDLAFQDSEKGLGSYEVLKEQRKEFCNVVHAEKNAIAQCSVHGTSPVGGTMYSTNYPCPGCVRDAIIPNKIAKVVIWKDYLRNVLLTRDEYDVSKYWLGQAKIEVVKLNLPEARINQIFQESLRAGDRLDYRFKGQRQLFAIANQ
jgi:dCMP deaminase